MFGGGRKRETVLLALVFIGVIGFWAPHSRDPAASPAGRSPGGRRPERVRGDPEYGDWGHDPPPEDLATIAVCGEKCSRRKENCDPEFQAQLGHFPAVKCLWSSETVKDDPYWKQDPKMIARNIKTVELVKWGARQARRRGGHTEACEHHFTPYHTTIKGTPMMFPEEFEMFVKTLARRQPETYLEWGSGQSTSFYPLLASGQVTVIDGFPPWCGKVQASPVVSCMVESKRLSFYCKSPVRPDGSAVKLLAEGRLPENITDADVNITMETYVNSVDETGVQSFDVALVDGRFRIACALKLLPYLHAESLLIMHDFWLRRKYHVVLDYFDVIGTARSLVVMRKKAVLPADHATAWRRFMGRAHYL